MKYAFKIIMIMGLVVSFVFNEQSVTAGAEGEAKEWKAPEEPRNEGEKAALEKKIEEHEKSIEKEDANDPKVQLEEQKIKAEKSVLDSYNARQALVENPNDAAAEKEITDSKKTLQETLKTIDAMLQGTFKPSGGKSGGTVLEKFASDYKNALQDKIRVIENSGGNAQAIEKQKFTTIQTELANMQQGKKSSIMPDADYSVSDYATEKKVLNLLDREISALVDSGIDTEKVKTLQQNIENRINEINSFKSGVPMTDNALDKRLDLSNKLPSDRLADLKKAFGIDFAKTYKTISEQMAAFKDLKQVLDTYTIPYADFYASNKIVAPGFILYLAGDARTNGDRMGVFADVMNSARETSYATENIRLGYLETALQDPSLKKYPEMADFIDSLKKEITDRKNQIKQFIANKKANKVPQPPAGTMAAQLKLSEKIPSDQMKAIRQEFVDVNQKIQKIFEEQKKFKDGENIYSWEDYALKELQDTLKPMQELLTQASELYGFADVGGEFEGRFVEMKDAIDGLAVQIEEIIKSRPSIGETVYNDVTGLFSSLFAIKTGLEPEVSPERAASALSLTLDKLNEIAARALVKQGELIKVAAAGAQIVGEYMQQAPDILEKTAKNLKAIEESAAVIGYLKTNEAVLKFALGGKNVEVIKELGLSAFAAAKDFANNESVKKAAGQIAEAGKTLQGAAEIADAVGEATIKEGTPQSQLDAIKNAETLIKLEQNSLPSSREEKFFETFNKVLTSFAKNISKWLRTAFTADFNTRYGAATSNYSTVRDQYFNYLGVSENSTPEQIKTALEKKAKEDPEGNKRALQDVAKNLSDMAKVLTDAQKALQAVQGNYTFVVDAWNNLSGANIPEKASAADIVNKIFDLYDNKIAYLRAAQDGITTLQEDIATFVTKGSALSTITDEFVLGLRRSLTQDLVATINNFQAEVKAIEDKLSEQKKTLLEQASGSSGAETGDGGFYLK